MGCFSSPSSSVPTPQLANPAVLQQQAQTAAGQNVTNSIALGEQVYPGLADARRQAISSLSSNLNNPVMFNPVNAPPLAANPLWDAAYKQTQNDLALGGQLPPEVRDQIARTAAATTGQAGQIGQAGANYTARDIGLNAYQIQQQRLQNAVNVGAQQTATNTGQQALQSQVQQFNSQFGANVGLQNNTQALQNAALITGLQLPASGLDPGQIASIGIANTNAQNSAAQQQAALAAQNQNASNSLWGSLLSTGLQAAGTVGGAYLGTLAAPGIGTVGGAAVGNAVGSQVGKSLASSLS
jgi:hypothetical protein